MAVKATMTMGGPANGEVAEPISAALTGRDVALLGVLAALALVFGYLEVLFPLPVPIPGIKLGLGNIVVLFALLGFGWRIGLGVMVVKVVASSFLFGNPAVLVYSLAGGVASYLAMCAASRARFLSILGVSMIGGVFHMFGQMVVVALVLAPRVALAFAAPLIVSGLLTGLIIGHLCRLIIRTVGRSRFFRARSKARRMAARAGRQTQLAASSDPSSRVFDQTLDARGGRVLKAGDVVAAGVCLALAVFCAVAVGTGSGSAPQTAEPGPVAGAQVEGGIDASPQGPFAVIQNTEGFFEAVPMDKDTTVVVRGKLGTNVVEVRDGRVRCSESDCANQICVDTGWVASTGSMVVCLPHELTVQVVDDPADATPLL